MISRYGTATTLGAKPPERDDSGRLAPEVVAAAAGRCGARCWPWSLSPSLPGCWG